MMSWKVLFALFVVYLVYTCIGGAVFQALEQENEDHTMTSQVVAFHDFLNNYSCVSKVELEKYIRGVIKAYDQGILQTETNRGPNWDFANSVFFSITVVTTIGYGNLSPATIAGKMFFIIYALIGIPITGIFLAGLGEKMSVLRKKITERTFISKCPKTEAVFKSAFLFALCLLLLVFIPSIVFTLVEGWGFGDSVYYCIVTMTTVGFGDFVPASSYTNNRAPYRLFVSLWIMFGLAWLAMIINMIATFYNEKISKTDIRISSKRKGANHPDNTPGDTDDGANSKIKKENEITSL